MRSLCEWLKKMSTKIYYQQHAGELKAYQHRYREEHKAELLAWHKEYYRKHRVSSLAYNRERHKLLKTKVLSHYSVAEYPACVHCGIGDIEVLCIDHIDGNGAEHRRRIKSGTPFYQWLVKNQYPEGYQILCWNCNHKKRLREAVEEEE